MDMEILITATAKMRKIASLLFILTSFFCITSCEKDAKVRLPEIPSRLVIVSFLSPQDTLLRVEVTQSEPLYNNAKKNKYKPVENAFVTISSQLGSGTFVYDPVSEYYVLDSALLKIREGIVYTISVSTPDGKSASASTRIPSANTSLVFEQNPDSTLKIKWTDPAETEDYYRLFWQSSSYYLFEGYNQNGNFSDTIYTKYVTAEWYPDTESKNGVLSSSVQFYYNFLYEPDTYIYLLHVSKEYYDYHTRLQLALNSGTNPFSEPVPMYSNINNGYGIFAGYNSYRVNAP
ncbi:hypothetical protein CNR22_14805 [Sphingobacteriaceae bacterium]|nr:hypothetical protein CNR22_14805 [Sphingobacteriaceae bacterium]